jgi:2-C-methyl-D-erythritol 2,4-cyclodiphosphate synthase
MIRIGIGQDTHRLVAGRSLILGGVHIAFELGAEGHSDSDALTHALIDALLGAMSDGDIGAHFPDSNPRWKDADSFDMLAHVMKRVEARGFHVVNADATVTLERPKLREYIGSMRVNVARALNVEVDYVSVKAKTGEGLDAVGRGEAVSAIVVVLLMSKES